MKIMHRCYLDDLQEIQFNIRHIGFCLKHLFRYILKNGFRLNRPL